MIVNNRIVLVFLHPVNPEYPVKAGYLPLGALSLAAYIRQRNPALTPLILDCNIINLEEIQSQLIKLRPEVVGLSLSKTGYIDALKVARLIKSWGGKVILGGHFVNGLASEIVQNRGPYSSDYCVDAVCQQDGEEAFYNIVLGKPFLQINNLVFQTRLGVRYNPVRVPDLNDLPSTQEMVDLVDIEAYYRVQKLNTPPITSLFSYSRKGCVWRQTTGGGCVFCALMPKKRRLKDPFIFWQDLYNTWRQYRPDSIFDVSDTFLDDYDWLKNFSSHFFNGPGQINLSFFARADQITEATIKLLKKIHPKSVFLGIDSADDEMLVSLNKGYTLESCKSAVKLLDEIGVHMRVYFVLGAPGETRHSLRNNLKFAQAIVKNHSVFVSVNILSPLPNAPAYAYLIKKTGRKYRGKDIYSSTEMQKDWIKHFTNVSYREITKILGEIRGLNK
jgi:anaerobic magnesium-protoporphyrin IX monomethyl ester cyclase